jgi:RHS repeat-associated protein
VERTSAGQHWRRASGTQHVVTTYARNIYQCHPARLSEVDDVFSNSSWNETHVHTYDHDDQLTATNHSVQNDEAYGYDINGNRSGNQTHLGATTSTTVTNSNTISTDGVWNLTYDAEKNLVTQTNISSGDKREYTFNHRNLVSLVTFKNSSNVIQKTIAYTYDQNNQLIARAETPYTSGTAGTTTTTALFYDGVQIVLAFQKVGSSNATISDRFTWGVERDHLLSDEQATSFSSAGTVYFVMADNLNTVRDAATYNSGTDTTTIAKHIVPDSFGNITTDTATGVVIVFGYAGRFTDSATGDTNNTNRWYATSLGRFRSEDPIKDGLNWQIYVGNHATYATDPSGLADPGVTWIKGKEPVLSAMAGLQYGIDLNTNTIPGAAGMRLLIEKYEIIKLYDGVGTLLAQRADHIVDLNAIPAAPGDLIDLTHLRPGENTVADLVDKTEKTGVTVASVELIQEVNVKIATSVLFDRLDKKTFKRYDKGVIFDGKPYKGQFAADTCVIRGSDSPVRFSEGKEPDAFNLRASGVMIEFSIDSKAGWSIDSAGKRLGGFIDITSKLLKGAYDVSQIQWSQQSVQVGK